MKLATAIGVTKSPHFKTALDRNFRARKELRSRLKVIEVDGSVDIFSIVISDHPINYFKRINIGVDDGFYQVIVGYDVDSMYPPNEDDKIIRMFAGWLRRGFQEADGYATKRSELLEIVDEWEKDFVNRISSEGGATR